MDGWRFRTNWLGKLILQRLVRWSDDMMDYEKWVDASTEDLLDYYRAIGGQS